MEELWEYVNWSVGCLLFIVAVVCSFMMGAKSGRIYERSRSARFWFEKNKMAIFRNKLQLVSFRGQVERLEREKESLAIQSEDYERVQSELAAYREKIGRLEHDMEILVNDSCVLESVSEIRDAPGLLCMLREDPLHTNLTKEEWSEIMDMTDLLFKNFLSDLRDKYSITRHEQEICCLIKWNFSRKEQLAIFNNTPDALTKSKGRLKKRLGLDEKTDLDTYIRLL